LPAVRLLPGPLLRAPLGGRAQSSRPMAASKASEVH